MGGGVSSIISPPSMSGRVLDRGDDDRGVLRPSSDLSLDASRTSGVVGNTQGSGRASRQEKVPRGRRRRRPQRKPPFSRIFPVRLLRSWAGRRARPFQPHPGHHLEVSPLPKSFRGKPGTREIVVEEHRGQTRPLRRTERAHLTTAQEIDAPERKLRAQMGQTEGSPSAMSRGFFQ